MIDLDIPYLRLISQRISPHNFVTPSQCAAWFGGIQAQDYRSVTWALGLRCKGASRAAVEGAFAGRTLIRTWLMRGTLQVVSAADVRWMLDLLAPRLLSQSRRRLNELELDDGSLHSGFDTLNQALEGGRVLSREELLSSLEHAGVSPEGQRGYHILRQAALRGLICFGPYRGKEQTFVLFDEHIAPPQKMNRDEALAKLATLYFQSHGPATSQDFRWWSGLAAADAHAGLDMIKGQLNQVSVNHEHYWFTMNDPVAAKEPSPHVYLLPAYDEYYLGYRNRDAVLRPEYDKRAVSNAGVFRPAIVIDGQIEGVWKRSIEAGTVKIKPNPFRPLTKSELQGLLVASDEYGKFAGLEVTVEL